MSRNRKRSGGYRLAAKAGFTKYRRSLTGEVRILHRSELMCLARAGSLWQAQRTSWGADSPVLSPMFQSLTLAVIWAQLEGWV